MYDHYELSHFLEVILHMDQFTKTIGRIDFTFQLRNTSGDYFYQILAGSLSFDMYPNEKGNWKIKTKVPMFIKNLEQELSLAIESNPITFN
jgi:hypothetical protein